MRRLLPWVVCVLFAGCSSQRRASSGSLASSGDDGGAAAAMQMAQAMRLMQSCRGKSLSQLELQRFAADEALACVKLNGGLLDAPQAQRTLNLIGLNLARFSEASQAKWVFGVLATEKKVVCSGSAGHVFISRGQVAAMKGEAELAGALVDRMLWVQQGVSARMAEQVEVSRCLAEAQPPIAGSQVALGPEVASKTREQLLALLSGGAGSAPDAAAAKAKLLEAAGYSTTTPALSGGLESLPEVTFGREPPGQSPPR